MLLYTIVAVLVPSSGPAVVPLHASKAFSFHYTSAMHHLWPSKDDLALMDLLTSFTTIEELHVTSSLHAASLVQLLPYPSCLSYHERKLSSLVTPLTLS